MSASAYASIMIGSVLSEDKVMELFGAKYEQKIHEQCPKDSIPNKDNNYFCGKCGTDLRYKEIIKNGIGNYKELESEQYIQDNKLDVSLLSEENCDDFNGVVIGEKTEASNDIISGGIVSEIDIKNIDKVISDVEKRISEFGIEEPVKMYLITNCY